MSTGTETSTGVETWVDRAEAKLTAAGHKRGGARRAVLELLDRQACALTAVEIEDALRSEQGRAEKRQVDTGRAGKGQVDTGQAEKGRAVSRASVYRILDELERLRLVQRVETGQAMVRYERVHEHEQHHHHLVCDGCGLVMPFSDDALEQAIDELSARVPLAVSEHEIVLHGACQACAEE